MKDVLGLAVDLEIIKKMVESEDIWGYGRIQKILGLRRYRGYYREVISRVKSKLDKREMTLRHPTLIFLF